MTIWSSYIINYIFVVDYSWPELCG